MTDDRRFDIAPVLEYYGWDVPYERSGWVKVRCQTGAHTDSNPSASINFDTGRIKCFACDFKGDAISVVQFYEEGLGYVDAVKRCEEVTGGSDQSLRTSGRTDRGVSRGARSDGDRRIYTPPWVRSRSAGRT